jgi:hypothetical protein
MSFSNYLENKILDKAFRNTDFTVTTVYGSLHTADPGETGASEATGGSYARQSVTFGAASSGSISNSATITFASMPAGTFTHCGTWDASTAGNFLGGGSLTASKTTQAGDTIEFTSGQFTVTLD